MTATVVSNGQSFNTGIRKYHGDYYSPKGHKYVEDFDIAGYSGDDLQGGQCLFQAGKTYWFITRSSLLIRFTIH
ncbi:MAG: hypothetical protein MZV63_25015 [Marinilabiliales bacterium]|nr:hypothetical protein [Marinilabiliales bacterium]